MEDCLLARLRLVWQAHNTTVHGSSKKKYIGTRHEKLGIYGVIKVQRALRITCTVDRVQELFRDIGVYPYNLDTILNNCGHIKIHKGRV
jgi:hypothetical protein